jgi:hypothetical protein
MLTKCERHTDVVNTHPPPVAASIPLKCSLAIFGVKFRTVKIEKKSTLKNATKNGAVCQHASTVKLEAYF